MNPCTGYRKIPKTGRMTICANCANGIEKWVITGGKPSEGHLEWGCRFLDVRTANVGSECPQFERRVPDVIA